MGEFGWAYISGSNQSIGGSVNSIQVRENATELTGSPNLTFDPASSVVALTGTLYVSGSIYAKEYNVDTTTKNIIKLSVTGSSKFGDSNDDVHSFTGSLRVNQNITASSFIGDGSNLTDVNAATVTSPLSIAFVTGSTAVSGGIGVFGSVTAGTFTGTATNVTVTDSTADTAFPVVFHDESNALLDDTGALTYNPNIGVLSATNLTVSSGLTVDTDTLHVDAGNDRVGIGTASPETELHIQNGSAGSIATTSGALLTLESNEKPKIHFQSPGAYGGSIIFGSPTDNDEGQIDYDHGSDRFLFKTGGNTKLAILGDNVGIGRADPQKILEVLKADAAQMRLSYSKYQLGVSSNVYTDFETLANGVMVISPTGNKTFLSGSIETSGSITGSTMKLTGLAAGTAATSRYLALDSNDNVVLTSSSGGGEGGSGGTIGAAEDGSYADGLFTDFTTSTTVGTAVDKFNEVLKILAPSPAPNLSLINADSRNGVSTKLSFDGSNAVSGHSASATTAGFSAVARNGTYEASSSGNNIRLGTYAIHDITGALNYNTAPSVTNNYVAYASGAFGNAETGSLQLEVNGAVLHSVDLSSFAGAGNPATGSGSSLTGDSGFVSLSVSASSFDGNNAEWYIFKHRTAKYKVASGDQRKGWNYARVLHVIGGTTYSTNYVEWVADPVGSAVALTATDARIEDIVLRGSKYLSGVQYNTGSNANYKVLINNMYRNVYPSTSNTITFGVTNSTTPAAQSVPSLGGGDDNTKSIEVTGALAVNVTSLLSSSLTANVNATHPLKADLSSAGSATTGNGFLIDNRTLASSNLIEKFHDESYRITSASYDTQNSVTADAAQWNSETHMTGSNVDGHQDGLLLFNQRLYSPVDGDIPNGGNFSTLTNVESGQPDYSGVTGNRTFYRVVTNSSGVIKRDMKIETSKNSTTFNNSSLGAANAHFFVKVPGTTGWMDISQDFVYGQIQNNDGALISGASNDVDSGNNTHHISFGTASVAAGGLVVVKIIADESWSGYLSQITFTMGATTNTANESLALDDIDLDDTAGVTAKLSFGSSNAVTGYTNVAGGVGSMGAVDSNATYTDDGDTNRGVFKVAEVMGGTLNEDVSANGDNYPANSFKNAFTGSLLLVVNNSTASTLSLANLSANNNLSSNTGFSVGAVGFSTTSDGIPDYTKPYRTGTYSIGTAQQRSGWNYARVVHRIGDTDTVTNYVQWVVDPSGSVEDTAVANEALSNFGHTTKYYQSGIGYFASRPTGSYSYLASNFYRSVYATGSSAINFPTTTRCSITNVRMSGSGVTTTNSASATSGMAVLNNSADCELTTLQVTGTVLFDASPSVSISGGLGQFTAYGVTVNSTIRHPFKDDKTTTSLSKNNFMIYSGSVGSTNENTLEYFGMESYRIVSGNYDTQTEATQSANKWNSSTAMNNGGTHDDGMVTADGHLISPFQIGNKGDTRSVKDGGSLQAPDSNPNYSTLTNATRTYYRYFKNNTGNDRSSITITLHGSGSMVEKSTALGNNGNFHLEVKVPESTAWLDAGKSYISNNKDVDGSGALVGGSSPTPISTGGTSFSVTFNGGSQLGTGGGSKAVVLKLSAHKDWIGYLERITVAYS
jgi:hypothetical protein